ncbi:MAG: tail fiber domain-containing protein, partial [Minisyncoccia bacterium]
MPLARLENFLKNLNGNTLYVDPNELDATDSIENRGNSRLRPFKTIQRALLEAARFSYVAGSNNDLFDQTTILISPGTHYIDNRPGYYVDSSNVVKDINNSTKTISEFNIVSNFDITDVDNELYIYNSVDGGVILPKGTSLVATDLRKTKIRPLFVPDPESAIDQTAIFKVTGSCYVFGFTIFDGDPLGKVFNTYGSNKVTPSYSHHKLTAFEYADGVNNVIRNSSDTGYTDLDMYYYKLALGYGQQSGRSVLDGYLNFQPNVDEYRIVGELGVGSIG